MDTSEALPVTQGRGRRVEDRHLALVVDKEVIQEHAQRWDPGMKVHWDATHASPLEGADTAISAWVADQRKKADEEEVYWKLVSAATEHELAAWRKFKAFKPGAVGTPSQEIVDTRLVERRRARRRWRLVGWPKGTTART